MKSIILLIALLTAAVYSQTPNWTNVKETNITVGKYDGVDIFTNQEGNHIIVQNSSSLKYYKMNINGQAGSPITLESTSVVTPSISGDESRLYVVYKRTSDNNIIRTKYSTDGGASWSFTSNLSTPTGNASSMESVFSNNKLHVTFEISNIIYYSWYKEGQGWTSPVQVSTSGQNGNTPRIAAWHTSSQDRVLFLYRKNDTESRWREWNAATNNWVNNPQTAFTVSANQSSMPKGFAVDANYIYSYYEYTDYYPYYAIYSQNQQRLRSNNTLVYTSIAQKESFVPKVFSTTTANNISHIAFYFNGLLESGYDIGIIRNKHTGSGITFDQAYQYNYYGQNEPTLINISSASNDVYLIWKDGLSNYLKFIYDDQAPLAPSDYSVSIHQSGSNYYPKLTWQLNNEPDIRLKTSNAYKIERRTRPLNGS